MAKNMCIKCVKNYIDTEHRRQGVCIKRLSKIPRKQERVTVQTSTTNCNLTTPVFFLQGLTEVRC